MEEDYRCFLIFFPKKVYEAFKYAGPITLILLNKTNCKQNPFFLWVI